MTLRPAPKPTPRPKRAKKPVPRRNEARAARRYARDFGEKGDWTRLQPCCCTRKYTGTWINDSQLGRVQVVVVAAHFPARSIGGRAKDLVPLSDHLHKLAHHNPKGHRVLELVYGVDFKALAAYYEALWQKSLAARTP